MVRKTSKSVELTVTAPTLKAVSDAAKTLGIAEFRLLELFAEALELPEAMLWESIPSEYENLLEVFKVKLLEPTPVESQSLETPMTLSEMLVTVEQPAVESKPARKRGRPSKAELARRAEEANQQALQKAQDVQAAQSQQSLLLDEAKENQRLLTLETAVVEEFTNFTEEQELRLNVRDSLNTAQINSGVDNINRRLEAINERLANLGSGYRVMSAEELESKAEESANSAQKHQDFLSQWKTRSWLQDERWA